MATSLYDLSVRTYLQTVTAAVGFLDKGASHCAAEGIDLAEVVATRLYPDMANFHFQAVCISHHSLGAIAGLQTGEFGPPSYPETDYAGLQQRLADTRSALEALAEDEINGLSGGQLVFKIGDNEIPFTNENFILSFSLPNFYFHTATAYDILRSKGVPLGKRDFLGQLKMGV